MSVAFVAVQVIQMNAAIVITIQLMTVYKIVTAIGVVQLY